MTINPVLKIIRVKKLGLLIRDARVKSGKSLDDCAQAMGISDTELTAFEFGERPPTLPELEILAYYLELPLEHFWGNQTLHIDENERAFDATEIKRLRQNEIGALIRQARIEAVMTEEELAEKAGISVGTLTRRVYSQNELKQLIRELQKTGAGIMKIIPESGLHHAQFT